MEFYNYSFPPPKNYSKKEKSIQQKMKLFSKTQSNLPKTQPWSHPKNNIGRRNPKNSNVSKWNWSFAADPTPPTSVKCTKVQMSPSLNADIEYEFPLNDIENGLECLYDSDEDTHVSVSDSDTVDNTGPHGANY